MVSLHNPFPFPRPQIDVSGKAEPDLDLIYLLRVLLYVIKGKFQDRVARQALFLCHLQAVIQYQLHSLNVFCTLMFPKLLPICQVKKTRSPGLCRLARTD